MKHAYKHHTPSGVKTQVWSPIQIIKHNIDRLNWWLENWAVASLDASHNKAAHRLLSNINHNLQEALNTANNPSKAFTIWTKPDKAGWTYSAHPQIPKTIEPHVYLNLVSQNRSKVYYIS